jgi:two-component system, cell cycle response regulator
VARLVRSSHESYDGTGYPDGLVGEAIPIGSRIISVCDAFDAMTSDRPYRLAMSPHDALAELERCSGAQFDAKVVAALQIVLSQPPQDPDRRPSSEVTGAAGESS